MDNNTIISIILTILISGIFAPFCQVIFDKLFTKYDPNLNKFISGLKTSLVFTFRYVLPVFNVIYIFIVSKNVDKLFVLLVAFSVSSFLFNILTDIFLKFMYDISLSDKNRSSIITNLLELTKDHIKLTKELKDEINIKNEIK